MGSPSYSQAALPRFFAALGGVEMKAFEPRAFLQAGGQVSVLALVHLEYTVKRTGRTVRMDQVHWSTVDERNKVRSLVHFEDTAQVVAAVAHDAKDPARGHLECPPDGGASRA